MSQKRSLIEQEPVSKYLSTIENYSFLMTSLILSANMEKCDPILEKGAYGAIRNF